SAPPPDRNKSRSTHNLSHQHLFLPGAVGDGAFAAFEPRAEAAPGEGNTGIGQQHCTEGCDARYGLADETGDLAGVREPEKKAQLSAWRILIERLTTDHFCRIPVECDRRAFLRLAAITSVDRKGNGLLPFGRETHCDRAPAVDLATGDLQQVLHPFKVRNHGHLTRWRTRAAHLRRFLTHDPEDQVVRPRIRNHHGGCHHDRQRQEEAETEHVVPVEIPCLARKLAPELESIQELHPLPPAGKPQVKSAQNDEEEEQVCRARYGLAGGAALALHSDPPVDLGDRPEEVSDAGGLPAEYGAGVRIDEQNELAPSLRACYAEAIRFRFARPHGEAQRRSASGFLEYGCKLLHGQLLPSRRGRRYLIVARVGPGNDLLFIRQQDAGDRHQQDDHPGGHPGRQVAPEQDLAKGFHRDEDVRGLAGSRLFSPFDRTYAHDFLLLWALSRAAQECYKSHTGYVKSSKCVPPHWHSVWQRFIKIL